jgi:hypothetical protein
MKFLSSIISPLRPFEKRRDQVKHWLSLEGEECALTYLRDMIEFYDTIFIINHGRWRRWQIVTIVTGALATIVAAVQFPPEWGLSPIAAGILRAVPVAVTSISAGLMGAFRYQGEAVRQGMTADALKAELAAYKSKAAPYGATHSDRVSVLISRVGSIIAAERGNWQSQFTPKDGAATQKP